MALYYVSYETDFSKHPFDTEAFWQRVAKASSVDVWKGSSMRRSVVVPLAIAAGIAIVAVGIKHIPNVFVTQPSPALTKTYSTKPAQRAKITLADGSVAILAPSTTLRVTGVAGRKVELAGEALFTVTQSDKTPFTVISGNTVTRVLGTSFGVRKYADEENVRVVVAEGKVVVGQGTEVTRRPVNNTVGQGAGVVSPATPAAPAQQATLSAGDIATVDSHGAVHVEHDAERAIDWLAFAHGKIVIDVQSLSQAAPQLSRWLDVDIRVAPSVAGQRLKTVLEQGSPTAVLDEIAVLTETKYTRRGRVVEFTAR